MSGRLPLDVPVASVTDLRQRRSRPAFGQFRAPTHVCSWSSS